MAYNLHVASHFAESRLLILLMSRISLRLMLLSVIDVTNITLVLQCSMSLYRHACLHANTMEILTYFSMRLLLLLMQRAYQFRYICDMSSQYIKQRSRVLQCSIPECFRSYFDTRVPGCRAYGRCLHFGMSNLWRMATSDRDVLTVHPRITKGPS